MSIKKHKKRVAMKEQRKFTRHETKQLIDLSTTDLKGSRTEFQMGRVLDISMGGLRIETQLNLDVTARIEITAGIENNLVDLVGLVTHTEKHANHFVSGIKVLSISPESRNTITHYIERELTQTTTLAYLNETMH